MEESPGADAKRMKEDKPDIWQKTTVLCWGAHDLGQLGLGDTEDEHIALARDLKIFQNRRIKNIGCGLQHTVFVMQDGSVYSCGSNECGQLGHDKPNKVPEQISALETQVVRKVRCGVSHNVALTDEGQMFAWGDNLSGQLGCGYTDKTYLQKPRLIRHISSSRIIQISCGNNHTIALADDGHLFSWGMNTNGQLGLGVFSDKADTPQTITCLQGLPIRQIAAGGFHSFFLTKSGALFGCGKNTAGQLGIGEEADKFYPTLCKTLRSQKIKYVACGEEFTVALTKDGGVFTFGSGSYGQLGHNTKNNETLPKKVFELMGSRVTQVACGWGHLLALVPSSGRVYAFGLGGGGQLGSGVYDNKLLPTNVKGPLVPYNKDNCKIPDTPTSALASWPPCVVKQIFSGGNQSFAIVSTCTLEEESADFRTLPENEGINELSEAHIRDLVSVPANSKPQADQLQFAEKTMKSACCMNGSFLLDNDEHYGCSAKKHGVNLDLASQLYSTLGSLPNRTLVNQMEGIVEKSIETVLPSKPPDVESLRVYLTTPCCHMFNDPSNYRRVICPFGKALMSLGSTPAKVIDKWWGAFSPEELSRLVRIYKQTVMFIIDLGSPPSETESQIRQHFIYVSMEVLKKLNNVNESNGQIVPYDSFYMPELSDKINIPNHYVTWIQQQRSRSQEVSFCSYPFVFDGNAKTELLQTDALFQMRNAVDEVHRRNFLGLLNPTIDPHNPCLVLYVSRDNIVQDTISQLTKQGNCDFKKPLKVTFLGEEAIDDGGVRKEFFLLLIREVLDPKYGMFQYFEESRLLWFNIQPFEDTVMYRLIGLLCGLAIYNSTIIDLKFPLALHKKLLKKPIIIEDLKELQPAVGKSCQDILDYDGEDFEETFGLTFETTREIYGEIVTVELKPHGSRIDVTKENRKEYVDALIDYTFNKCVKDQFEAFSDGFHRVIGGQVLSLFHPQELQSMIVGNENYDWENLEQSCQYKGDYCPKHQTIQLFWDVFRELQQDEKKQFLKFLTGCDKIPIHGMKAIKMIIQPTGGGEDYLPVAHTCFNLLDLPKYTKRDGLKRKLLTAIEQSEGFGLV